MLDVLEDEKWCAHDGGGGPASRHHDQKVLARGPREHKKHDFLPCFNIQNLRTRRPFQIFGEVFMSTTWKTSPGFRGIANDFFSRTSGEVCLLGSALDAENSTPSALARLSSVHPDHLPHISPRNERSKASLPSASQRNVSPYPTAASPHSSTAACGGAEQHLLFAILLIVVVVVDVMIIASNGETSPPQALNGAPYCTLIEPRSRQTIDRFPRLYDALRRENT